MGAWDLRECASVPHRYSVIFFPWCHSKSYRHTLWLGQKPLVLEHSYCLIVCLQLCITTNKQNSPFLHFLQCPEHEILSWVLSRLAFCQPVTSWVIWEECASIEKMSSINLACGQAWGAFCWLNDWCGSAQLTVGEASLRLMVQICIRRQVEQARKSKAVRRIPPWPLYQVLPRLDFLWWCTVMWCQSVNPFLPQAVSNCGVWQQQ